MSVTITCTAMSGSTVNAQATSAAAVTWTLSYVLQGVKQNVQAPDMVSGTMHSATWTDVPAAPPYTVTATTPAKMTDSQPVPFGNCT